MMRTRASTLPNIKRPGPSLGEFRADPTKPYVILRSNSFHVANVNHSQLTTRQNSVNSSAVTSPGLGVFLDDCDSDGSGFGSLMLGSPANLMLSGLLEGSTETDFQGHFTGPVEAFYSSMITEDEYDNGFFDDEDDEEELLDINAFIDFGEGSSDSEGDADESEPPSSPIKGKTTNFKEVSYYHSLHRLRISISL